jgi:hypothetical protein
MKNKPKLDMDKIAKTLGAERGGEVSSTSGHFGAMRIAAEIQARFRAPTGGGRSSDPSWTARLPSSRRSTHPELLAQATISLIVAMGAPVRF